MVSLAKQFFGRGGIFLALAASLCALSACNQRTLEITSEPPGALVKLNDIEVGRTPLQVNFKYYGVYDVRLALEGYENLATSAEAVAPWYEYPGPDLATAATSTNVRRGWNFILVPLPTDARTLEQQLIVRGRELAADHASALPPAAETPAGNPAAE